VKEAKLNQTAVELTGMQDGQRLAETLARRPSLSYGSPWVFLIVFILAGSFLGGFDLGGKSFLD